MLTCYLLDGRLNFTIKYLTAVIFRCASLKYIYRQRTSLVLEDRTKGIPKRSLSSTAKALPFTVSVRIIRGFAHSIIEAGLPTGSAPDCSPALLCSNRRSL